MFLITQCFQKCSFTGLCDITSFSFPSTSSCSFLVSFIYSYFLKWFSIIDCQKDLVLGHIICYDDLDDYLFCRASQKCKEGLFELLFTTITSTLSHTLKVLEFSLLIWAVQIFELLTGTVAEEVFWWPPLNMKGAVFLAPQSAAGISHTHF